MALFKPLRSQSFFKDHTGKIVLWQFPNVPLFIWLACELLARAMQNNTWHTDIQAVGRLFLFTWAFLEVAQGVNYFRRLLGLLVLIAILISSVHRWYQNQFEVSILFSCLKDTCILNSKKTIILFTHIALCALNFWNQRPNTFNETFHIRSCVNGSPFCN